VALEAATALSSGKRRTRLRWPMGLPKNKAQKLTDLGKARPGDVLVQLFLVRLTHRCLLLSILLTS